MLLRSVDLNLIPVLRELLQERNVSKAAANLGLSQSATSAALARLRVALNDPLLVQVGRRMELTDRAKDLIVPVEMAREALEAVWVRKSFDPATTRRRFVIATADYVAMILGARLIAELRIKAPGVTVQFIDVTARLIERLRHGEIDFAILPRTVTETFDLEEIRTALLFRDEFVAVAGRNHRFAKTSRSVKLRAADYESEPHITFRIGSNPVASAVDREVAGHEAELATAFSFQQFSLLPLIALETDSVALVQRRLAEKMMQYLPLRIVPSPVPTTKLELHAMWSPVRHTDPAHQWFLDLLKTTARDDKARRRKPITSQA